MNIPETIDIPAAWIGEEIANSPDKWRWTLRSAEIDELKDAAKMGTEERQPPPQR